MPNIKAFAGYYYDKNKRCDDVIAPPYDVISPYLQGKLYKKSPFNIIRLILGKEELGDNKNVNKYTRAEKYLNDWIEKGILKKDDKDSLYILQQEFVYNKQRYSRLGFIALMELTDFKKGEVYPHEETLSAPKVDRLKLLEAVKANFSPIFSLYIDSEKVLDGIFDNLKKTTPFLEAKAADEIDSVKKLYFSSGFKAEVFFSEVKNKIWKITDEKQISALVNMLKNKKVFIADGHHRYETALNYLRLHPEGALSGMNYILTYFSNIDDKGLLVLPTHRLIKKSNVNSLIELKEKLKYFFEIQNMPDTQSVLKEIGIAEGVVNKFGLYMEGQFMVLTLKLNNKTKEILQVSFKNNESDIFKKLDVTVLHKVLIEKIIEAEQQENIDFTKSAIEAVELVKANKYQMALFLKSTSLSQIKEIALCGERMPKKSTYFYPKLLSGLIINKF